METETLKKNLASLSGFLKTEFIDDAILCITDMDNEISALKKENEELKSKLELEQVEKVDAQSKLIVEQTRNRFYSIALQKLGCDMESLSSEIHEYLTQTDK